MLKRMRRRPLLALHPIAHGTTLHKDDRVVAILPCDGRGEPRDELCRGLTRHLFKTLGGEMVAFIDNQVPIIAHQILNHAFSDQALNCRHIQQVCWLLATTAHPSDGARRLRENQFCWGSANCHCQLKVPVLGASNFASSCLTGGPDGAQAPAAPFSWPDSTTLFVSPAAASPSGG